MPALKFKGTLQLTDYETPIGHDKKTTKIIHPKLSEIQMGKNTSVSPVVKKGHPLHEVELHKIRSVSPLDHPHDVQVEIAEEANIFASISIFSASLASALLVVLACIGFETHVQVSGESLSVTYAFEIERLAAALVTAF